jgi:hypothetical protein
LLCCLHAARQFQTAQTSARRFRQTLGDSRVGV